MRGTRLSLLLTSLFFSYSLQAGVIRGLVTDKKSGEPLVGVPVALEGTSYGAITGLDGSYEIKNVPGGTYKIKVLCATCEDWNSSVTLNQDDKLSINVELKSKDLELKEVQVKTKRGNGSDEQARYKEKHADEMMNAISARSIQLLPDITVANVLQRMSGVTVQRDQSGEARYAIIRGMDKRYNNTLVNGIEIPSPDDKTRSVPMDVFPSDIIDRLEVIKALTPSMQANAIGGTMNLVMKDAPDHLVVSASAATGYNQTLLDRTFSQFSKSNMPEKDPAQLHGADYSATAFDFNRNALVYNQVHVQPNSLFNLSIGDRFLKNKKLGVMVAGSYQNIFKGSDYIFFKPSAQADVNNTAQFTDLEVRKYDMQQTRSSAYAHVDYKFNENHSITLSSLYVQLNELETRTVVDTTININRTGAGTGPVDLTWRSGVRKQSIISNALSGKHAFSDRLKLDWIVADNKAVMDIPGMAELHTAVNISTNTEKISSVKYSWENTHDHDDEGYLNLTYLVPVAGRDLELKAGGMMRIKDRDNYYNEYTLHPLSGKPFGSILTDTLKMASDPQGLLPYNNLTYTVNEMISAGYVQGKMMMTDKLQALAGVRVEQTHTAYTFAQDPNTTVGVTGTFDYVDVLPSVHFKYILDPGTNLRLSYFKSICRPAFYELVPYDNTMNESFDAIGNYNLKHSQADNFDARYEWFGHGNDQLLVGAFYKSILNPIEYALVSNVGPSALAIQPINPVGADGGASTAYNYGLEFQATKFFHWFGVSANYTYTHSQIAGTVINYHRNAAGSLVKDPVTEVRTMQGQAAHIGNLSLIYKGQKNGLDAQLAAAYTGPQIAFLSSFEGLNYWQKGMVMLDFSAEKKIAKHLSLFVKVNNILNTAMIYELREDKTPFVSKAPGTSYQLPYQTLPNSVLVEKALYGRNYLMGIRFKLN